MKLKRLLSAIIGIMLVLCCLPINVSAETIATGTCGEKLIWELSNQGVLTISGTGPMFNYSEYSNPVPWSKHKDDITAVVVKHGVTYIGSHSFASHKNLKTVDLPTGMSEIGASAFSNCDSLETIVIPEGVTKVGNNLFHSCRNLKMVVLPKGLRWISGFMFYGCYELAVVVIPKSVYQINRDAFSECRSLWHILYTGSKSKWSQITIQGSVYDSEFRLESATRHYNCTGNEITDLANKNCSLCNAPCEHKWDEGKVTKEASCAEEGKCKFTCKLCGKTKTEAIPKLDTHAFGIWTAVDLENHKRICLVCGLEESTAHTWDMGIVTKQPSCTEKGEKTYSCADCSHTYTDSIEATGHSYGEWVQTKAPTQEEYGIEERTCSNCGIKGQRLIAKLEPVPTFPVPTEPSATTPTSQPSQPPVEPIEKDPHKYDTLIIIAACITCIGATAMVLLRKKTK